jgi:hypothetical protein
MASWDQFSWPLALPSLVVLAGSATAALGTIRRDRTALLGPLPYLPAALGLYYGVGPLVYIWGSYATIAMMDAFFPVAPPDYLQVQGLVAVGVVSIGLGLLIAGPWRHEKRFNPRRLIEKATIPTGVVLCLIGFAVEGFVELPRMTGADAGIPSGFVQQVGDFVMAGVIVLRLAAAGGRRGAVVFWGIALATQVTFGLFQTSKFAVLMPLVITLGVEVALGTSTRVVLPLALGAGLMLPSFATVMLIARSSLQERVGLVSSVNTRLEAFRSANETRRSQDNQDTEIQQWWARISYVNYQSFVLQDYNNGNHGSTLKNVELIMIPRWVWPDKPNFSMLGTSFNVRVSGRGGSAAAPGVLAEGYWNFGWLGVFLSGGGLGLCIGLAQRAVSRVLRARWLAMTGMLVLAIRLSIRVDGWMVTDYIGVVALAVPLYAGVWLVQNSWNKRAGSQTKAQRSMLGRVRE